ncbi:hypothetical protein Esti_000388 [Eimeria stiedai]
MPASLASWCFPCVEARVCVGCSSFLALHRVHLASLRALADLGLAPNPLQYRLPIRAFWTIRDGCISKPIRGWDEDGLLRQRPAAAPLNCALRCRPLRCRPFSSQRASREAQAATADGEGLEGGRPLQLLPLRRRLRAIRRVDLKLQRYVLTHGLGRPRCQRAQRLLKRGDANSVSARCPLFLQQLKPRLKLWKKALTLESVPPALYPEVAFAGRSNAGKSTLLNELCGRSGTAFVSRRPGSTQELYFFKAGSPCCLCLVDLPGYGYAEAEASKRLQWTEMCLLYLKTRPNLRRVFLLVDSRWGLKVSDMCLLSFFERHRVPFQLVLTKADLPEQKSLVKILQIVSEEVKKFKGCVGPPIAVSALRHRGLDPLRAEIDKLRLSKEVIVGRLKMQARQLLFAKPKEARASAKAQRGSNAHSAQTARSQTEGETRGEGEGAGADTSSDIVARALQRWGSSITQSPHSKISRAQNPWSGLHAPASADSDEAGGGAASAAGLFSSMWTDEPVAGDRVGQPEERREEGISNRLSSGETEGLTVSAAAALESALESVAKVVPLPQSPNVEALIRDLLPCSPSDDSQQAGGVNTSGAAHSSHVEARESQAVEAHVRSHSEQKPTADMQDKTASVSSCSFDERAGPWGDNAAFYEFTFDQQTRLNGGCTSSASATIVNPEGKSLSFQPEIEGDAVRFVTSEARSFSPMTDKSRVTDNAIAGQSVHADPDVSDDDASAGTAPRRPFEALRLEDWRARRVSRTAVEIDMRLSRDEAAAAGATLHLSLDRPTSSSSSSNSSRCSADEQTSAAQKLQRPRQALPDLKHVYREGGSFVDEDTLAAEQLQGNRRRSCGASSSAKSRGALENDMQRSFNQKWRRELLPIVLICTRVDGSSTSLSSRSSIDPIAAFAEASNPFRIPPDFITTREDSGKNHVTHRMAFELRLQRTQERLPTQPDEAPRAPPQRAYDEDLQGFSSREGDDLERRIQAMGAMGKSASGPGKSNGSSDESQTVCSLQPPKHGVKAEGGKLEKGAKIKRQRQSKRDATRLATQQISPKPATTVKRQHRQSLKDLRKEAALTSAVVK